MEKTKNVHVLYIVTKLELGGAQKVCLSLLKGVENKQCTTSLLSGTDGKLVPLAQQHHTTYLLKSLRREVGIKTFFLEFVSFFQMIAQMRKLKKQYRNLIIHTHSTKAGIMGRWAAFFAQIKSRVHTVHGFGFHEHQSKLPWFIHRTLESLTSLITTHYICVSNNDQKIGNKYLPRFSNKSSVIRAAVDEEQFYHGAHHAKTCKIPNHFIFGTTSCFKPQKNLIDLLKAFTLMYKNLSQENKARVHLQLIGDGEQRKLIETWLRKNNMSHKVDLLGWQPNVAQWLQSWDTFVMSSLWEGLPCAIVEARLIKLPIISYKIAGIPEVVKNKKNGFLIKPGDWKTLSKRMQEIVEDKELHKTLATHQEDLSDFSNNTMIEKHRKLYKKLAKR